MNNQKNTKKSNTKSKAKRQRKDDANVMNTTEITTPSFPTTNNNNVILQEENENLTKKGNGKTNDMNKDRREFVAHTETILNPVFDDCDYSSVTNSTNNHRNKSFHELYALLRSREATITQLQKEQNGMEPVLVKENEEQMVIRETKKWLFPKLQFIRNQESLDDYESPRSIGHFLLTRLCIPREERRMFWYTYKSSVRRGIKMQRNIVHNALKAQFFGTYYAMSREFYFICK